jgi:5-methylcytosine-specific restriction endonuclease McrA
MNEFTDISPSLEDYWRSIILFGRNTASYKFALAKTLLEVAPSGKTFVSLDELAEPFSKYITEHLKICEKQGTNPSNSFLVACSHFNAGEIDKEQLLDKTVKHGFRYVIDAFHVVGAGNLPIQFFESTKQQAIKGITLNDNLFALLERYQYQNLPFEVEARWRLVESAWQLGMSKNLVSVDYQEQNGVLIPERLSFRRTTVTSCRDALNGYQKGKCFYCFSNISIEDESPDLADVDHFLPHTLKPHAVAQPIDGVWNLVLACQTCNRGVNGKFDRIPELRYLERLHTRNEFLISSHHPLRETLISQTGDTVQNRTSFLQYSYNNAKRLLIHTWKPKFEYPPAF